MLVQRAKLGDLHVSQHATWGMSAKIFRRNNRRNNPKPTAWEKSMGSHRITAGPKPPDLNPHQPNIFGRPKPSEAGFAALRNSQ
jgi:hypothetical protein